MSTLSQPLADHIACVEAYVYCARNGVKAAISAASREDRELFLGAALDNIEAVIASLREAQASLAHERDIAESRASPSGVPRP